MKSFRQQNEPNNQEGADMRKTAEELADLSPDQLTATLYSEVAKAKANGTLSDSDLNRFCESVAPMLNEEQAAKLRQLIDGLIG